MTVLQSLLCQTSVAFYMQFLYRETFLFLCMFHIFFVVKNWAFKKIYFSNSGYRSPLQSLLFAFYLFSDLAGLFGAACFTTPDGHPSPPFPALSLCPAWRRLTRLQLVASAMWSWEEMRGDDGLAQGRGATALGGGLEWGFCHIKLGVGRKEAGYGTSDTNSHCSF